MASDRHGGWYVGGQFQNAGTTAVSYLAHLKADGSLDTSFMPNPASIVTALVLSPDGTKLYAGGAFGVNKYDATTGAQLAFAPSFTGSVQSLALSPDGSVVYVGGDTSPDFLMAFNAATATTIAAFNPAPNNTVRTIAVAPGGTVYASGYFTKVNSGSTTRSQIAAFNPSNGTVVAGFNPNVSGGTVNSIVLSTDGTLLYAGGGFSRAHGVTRNFIAAFDTAGDGTPTAFNPDTDNAVYSIALAPGDATLFAAGGFSNVNLHGGYGVPRNFIAGFNTTTGIPTDFNPTPNSAASSVATDGTTVVAGGVFTFVNRIARTNVAAVDAMTGVVRPGFASDADGVVFDLLLKNGSLFAAGNFTHIGGVAQKYVAKLNSLTGSVSDTFNPVLNGTAYALASTGNHLFVGGAFTVVNGHSRSYAASLNMTSGDLGPWAPPLTDMVGIISIVGNKLYVAGPYVPVVHWP